MTTANRALPDRGGTRGRPARLRWRKALTGWLFAFPFLAIFLAFLLIPILASFILSFTDFGLMNLRDPASANFVGVENYSALAGDEKFLKAAWNTAYFVVAGVPLTLAFALLIAVGLNNAVVSKVSTFFRVGYYLPVVTSIVAIAVIWRYLFNPEFGLVNAILNFVGLGGLNWLGDPMLAMPVIIALGVWRNVGFVMVIFLAGLQGIDRTLYEAAKVDGARAWARFWYITLPMLRPTMLFCAVITSIGYLQVFEEPFVMTDGGPLDSTLTVSMLVYEQGFQFFNMGYASAVAYALFVAIVALAFIQFRLLRPQT